MVTAKAKEKIKKILWKIGYIDFNSFLKQYADKNEPFITEMTIKELYEEFNSILNEIRGHFQYLQYVIEWMSINKIKIRRNGHIGTVNFAISRYNKGSWYLDVEFSILPLKYHTKLYWDNVKTIIYINNEGKFRCVKEALSDALNVEILR